METQFKVLYREKYVPLKQAHATLADTERRLRAQRREAFDLADGLRTQLATAELKLRKATLDVGTAERRSRQLQQDLEVKNSFWSTSVTSSLAPSFSNLTSGECRT